MFEKLSLEAVIKEVREKGNSWAHIYRSNEEATKQQLILPILSALGWNIFSPKDIIPEIHTHKGGRVDYALYINNNCVAYLEAKSLGVNVISDENALEQLGLYCFKDGVRLGILTNGIQWVVIDAFKHEKKLMDRRLVVVDLKELPVVEIVNRLSYLTKAEIKNLPALPEKSIEELTKLPKKEVYPWPNSKIKTPVGKTIKTLNILGFR